jgi:predicted aspartyl protease
LAEIRDLKIGQLRASNVRTLIYPSVLTRDGRIAGLLGANFLRHYEIELDLASNRLNLFEQDHCPGQVVYWKADAVAVVPIRIVQTGHIILPVTLDGQSMDALLDTGSTRTNLTEEAARQYFHLSPKSPGMNAVGESLYKRMFDKLDLDGLAITHPTIFIREDRMSYGVKQSPQTGSRLSSAGESNGLTSLILGMSEMKRLRVFISYKEQKLYITPASTGAAAAATIDPSPSPAANTSK